VIERIRRTIVPAALACVAGVIASYWHVAAAGLPPGQHTATPKFWSEGPWRVTNYTPFELDFRIGSLTPGLDHDLWFSEGSSIEHIDSQRSTSTIPMPEPQWIVSGIAIADRQVWFTAGQSGRVGIVDTNGHARFIQVVARRNNPDLRDLFVNHAGELWFLDIGRSSIGYRSSSGRVVENPFAVPAGSDTTQIYNRQVYLLRMAHCMGKFWVVERNATASELEVIDENLRPHPFFIDHPKLAQLVDLACDSDDRLWLAFTDYRQGMTVEHFDAAGRFKKAFIAGFEGGNIAVDRSGGMWLIGLYNRRPRQTLLHFNSRGVMTTRILPVDAYAQLPIVEDMDQRLWLGINYGGSPIAVTELEPVQR
jgi:hypothetical protein